MQDFPDMGGFLKNTAILLGVLVCLPYLVELATRKPFAVHTSGAVILTGQNIRPARPSPQ